MSIVDNIRVKQGWGPDGYKFETLESEREIEDRIARIGRGFSAAGTVTGRLPGRYKYGVKHKLPERQQKITVAHPEPLDDNITRALAARLKADVEMYGGKQRMRWVPTIDARTAKVYAHGERYGMSPAKHAEMCASHEAKGVSYHDAIEAAQVDLSKLESYQARDRLHRTLDNPDDVVSGGPWYDDECYRRLAGHDFAEIEARAAVLCYDIETRDIDDKLASMYCFSYNGKAERTITDDSGQRTVHALLGYDKSEEG